MRRRRGRRRRGAERARLLTAAGPNDSLRPQRWATLPLGRGATGRGSLSPCSTQPSSGGREVLGWAHGYPDPHRPGPRRRRGAEQRPVRPAHGMLLDQQFPMERAFAGPAKVLERFGTLDPAALAAADPEAFADLCATPPAVHRYGRSMAGRIQALAAVVRDNYGGDASRSGPTPPPAQSSSPASRRCPASASRRPRSSPRCSASSSACAPMAGTRPRCLRRDGQLPLGRRRRRRRVAPEGARLQEGRQGGGQSREGLRPRMSAERQRIHVISLVVLLIRTA